MVDATGGNEVAGGAQQGPSGLDRADYRIFDDDVDDSNEDDELGLGRSDLRELIAANIEAHESRRLGIIAT